MRCLFSRRQALAGVGGVALSGCATSTLTESGAWSQANIIEASIARPRIPRREQSIRAHGAVQDADVRPAVTAAIAALAAQGGGRVVVPSGNWLCDGPIHLRSNIELHLESGATLRFSPNPQSYLPVVLTRWEGTDCYNYSPFIYARDCHDVALTGPGVIDGQGAAHWLPWRPEQRAAQTRLRDMGRDGVPVEQRVFGEGHKLRPHFVQFHSCERVLVDGTTLLDSPFWLIHPVYCSDVIVRNVTARSRHINSDGVDPDSSRRVLIEHCHFDVGDDGVAIKSGRDQDGWRVARPSEDIVIRNCRYSGETGGGVAIGSEMSGGVRNVFIENWTLPRANHALYFKANLDRGGLITDVHIRNIACGETDSVLIFTNDYHSYRGGDYPPRFERVTVENVNCDRTRMALHIFGHPRAPVRDVTLRDITVATAQVPLELRDIEGVRFENVRINGRIISASDAQETNSYSVSP
jgi:polygalacturonase